MSSHILQIQISENNHRFLHDVKVIVSGNGTFTIKTLVERVIDELVPRGEACTIFHAGMEAPLLLARRRENGWYYFTGATRDLALDDGPFKIEFLGDTPSRQPAEVDSDPPRGSPNFLQPPSVASVREVQSSSTGKRRRVCEETTLGMGGGSSSQVSERQGAMTADEWRTRLNNVAVKKSGTERITFRQLEEQGVFDPKLWQGITGSWGSIAQNWHKINDLDPEVGESLRQCYWVGIAAFDQTTKQLTARPSE